MSMLIGVAGEVAGLSYTFLRNPIRNHYKSINSKIIQKYVLKSYNIGTLENLDLLLRGRWRPSPRC